MRTAWLFWYHLTSRPGQESLGLPLRDAFRQLCQKEGENMSGGPAP